MVFLSTIPADPTQIDTAQLEKVNAFRERVSQRGGFYHRFPSREDFARALRVALMRRALEFGQRRQQGSLSGERSAPTAPPRGPTEEDEVGLLELFELGNQNFNWVTEATERMNQALTDLGERMTQRVEQMNRTSDTNLKRRYVDAAGEDLLNYANRTEAELAIFVSSYQSGIDAYMRGSRMLPLLGSAGVDTMRQSLGSLQSMKTSMVGAVGSMKQLRGSLDALPPLTTPLAKAKRRALGVIDNLLGEWDNAARLSEELIALLSELIARYPSADTSLS